MRFDLVAIILDIICIVFILRWVVMNIREFVGIADKKKFFTWRRFRNPLILSLVIFVPIYVIDKYFTYGIYGHDAWLYRDFFIHSDLFVKMVSIVLSLMISLIWIIYIRQLDIYEPEKWIYIIVIFVASCLSTEYLVQFGYEFVFSHGVIHPREGTTANYDFWYCFLVIGGIEELGKLIPVFLMLLVFKKAINEPYDYILYGSISALGFAFMENIMYVYRSDLANIGGRLLYSSVMHMTTTSIVCYGLMLLKYRYTKISAFIIIPGTILMAMFSHGFYDFWLIHWDMGVYGAITTAFLLITIHLWVTIKNNTINVSNFHVPGKEIRNDRLRSYLIISLTASLMLGYVLVALRYDSFEAGEYLFGIGLSYGFLVMYLAYGLSKYKIIKDNFNPLIIPFDFFVPKPKEHYKPKRYDEE